MASLAQTGQFINEPGRTYLDALADPPQGAVDALEWSKEQAQSAGEDVDPNRALTFKFHHTDTYKDQYDTAAMAYTFE